MFNWFLRLIGVRKKKTTDKNGLSRYQWEWRNLVMVDGKYRVEILEFEKNWVVYMSLYGIDWFSSDGRRWRHYELLRNEITRKELYKGM